MDNGPVPGHSLFTGCLIEGLRGGISQQWGQAATDVQIATDVEIATCVARRVREYPQSEQTPGFGTFDFHDHGHLLVPLLEAQPGMDRGSEERATIARPSPAAVPTAPASPGAMARPARDVEPPDRHASAPIDLAQGAPAARRGAAEPSIGEQVREKAWLGAGVAAVPTWLLSFAISGRSDAHVGRAVAVATIATAVVVCLVFFVTLAVLRAWNEP